jgi:chaperonin cofactor prefoldin
MKKVIVFFGLFILSIFGFAQEKTLPYTQQDRELLVRLDERGQALDQKVQALDKKMDIGFADMKAEFNKLNTSVYTLFGTCVLLIVSFYGFIFWERRNAMQPQNEATKALKMELDSLKNEVNTPKNQQVKSA